MRKLAGKNVSRVVDLLNERLAFERSGVTLYDRILARMRSDPRAAPMLERMQEHRDQEKEHEEWLEEQIRALGGDGRALSEKSVLVRAESHGIEHVIRRDPSLAHDFHALLTAELADTAGWELLVQLADDVGDGAAKKQFEKRLREEEEHLLFMRKAVEQFAKEEVLGEQQDISDSR
jgi:bacterioferritin (cytochrome b1)